MTVVAPHEDGEPTTSLDGPVRVERRFERGRAARSRRPARRAPHRRAGRAPAARDVPLRRPVVDPRPRHRPGRDAARRRRRGRDDAPRRRRLDGRRRASPRCTASPPRPRSRAPAWTSCAGSISRLADRVIVHEPAFTAAVPGATVVPHGIETTPTPRARRRARAPRPRPRSPSCASASSRRTRASSPRSPPRGVAGPDVELVVAGGEHPRLREAGDTYLAELRAAHPHARVHRPRARRAGRRLVRRRRPRALPLPQPVSASGALALALAHGTPLLMSAQMARDHRRRAARSSASSRAGRARRAPARARRATPAPWQRCARPPADLGRDRTWAAVARRHLEIYEEVGDADGAAGRRLRAA